MVRKYIVSIDSDKFEVEVEENGEVKSDRVVVAPAAAPVSAPVAAPVAAAAPAPAVEAAPAPVADANAASAEGNKFTSPLPGTLLRIVATQGTVVKENDLLCVIEAMKMENEIRSPYAGTVVSVAKNEGAMLNTGDLLFVIA